MCLGTSFCIGYNTHLAGSVGYGRGSQSTVIVTETEADGASSRTGMGSAAAWQKENRLSQKMAMRAIIFSGSRDGSGSWDIYALLSQKTGQGYCVFRRLKAKTVLATTSSSERRTAQYIIYPGPAPFHPRRSILGPWQPRSREKEEKLLCP